MKLIVYALTLSLLFLHTKASQLPFSIRASNGLSGDTCKKSEDCKGKRTCIKGGDCDKKSYLCICSPNLDSPICKKDGDCDSGEVCVIRVKELGIGVCFSKTGPFGTDPKVCSDTEKCPTGMECLSIGEASKNKEGVCYKEKTEDNEEKKDDGCIAAKSLRHLSKSELVYERDILAEVLCDKKESCATRGHMVKYHGAPMMMQTYCREVGCERRMMHVNSVKYKRGVTVPSETSGLEFTAFAARYATRVEEHILKAAVRVGL